ncbi:hypothetical protein QCA50_011647 [Cerrena zonata]|uniref:DUF6533 domain-containing protein n=1 Tax=Cerrena zonata TaxID=2478898 RepID=A0AAW0G4P7_9APHY
MPLTTTAAQHLITAGYIHVVVATVWFWDALTSFSEEVEAFRVVGHRMTLPDVIYILSRTASGGMILSDLLFTVMPHSNCNVTTQVVAWFGVFATPLNTLLFLIRADAVFNQCAKSRIAFGLLWLSTFATITSPFSFTGFHVEHTRYCALEKVKQYCAAGTITVAIFDTVVFLSIAYKIASFSRLDTRDSWSKFFMKGTGEVSSSLLLTGQLYYFPVITLNTLAIAVLLTPSVSPQYQGVVIVADVVFQNMMLLATQIKLDLTMATIWLSRRL